MAATNCKDSAHRCYQIKQMAASERRLHNLLVIPRKTIANLPTWSKMSLYGGQTALRTDSK